MRPLHQRRAPGEARAHAGHQHQVSFLEPPVRLRVRQGQRDRAGGSIAVPVDVNDHSLPRDAQLLRRVIHDPDVRLVRDVDVDLVDRDAAALEHGLRRRDEHTRRELEDLAPVHVNVAVARRLLDLARAAPGQREVNAAAPVRAELEAEEAGPLDLARERRRRRRRRTA